MYRIMQCEMDGETVKSCRLVAGLASTTEAAENLVARVAQAMGELGFDAVRGFWWARDPLGQEFRFFIELAAFDETDGGVTAMGPHPSGSGTHEPTNPMLR